MEYDVIIVGAGPAGLTAALYARRAGRSVLLLESGVPGGQAAYAPSVENWPGTTQITGAALTASLVQQVEALGAKLRLEGAAAAVLLPDGRKQVTGTAGTVFSCRALILANGLRRRRLGIPGENAFLGKGVSDCAACDAPLFRGKNVAVVGGGSAALDEALYLADLCPTVHLIHRRDAFRGEPYLIRRVMERETIKLHLNRQVTSILGGQTVAGLTLSGGELLAVSGLFLAIGSVPQNEPFAHLVPLTDDGYYDVGEDCAAPTPGVFVAGDCRRKPLRQLVTAAADGAAAARAADAYLNA